MYKPTGAKERWSRKGQPGGLVGAHVESTLIISMVQDAIFDVYGDDDEEEEEEAAFRSWSDGCKK